MTLKTFWRSRLLARFLALHCVGHGCARRPLEVLGSTKCRLDLWGCSLCPLGWLGVISGTGVLGFRPRGEDLECLVRPLELL